MSPLNPGYLQELRFPPVEQAYTDADTILYALSVGLGADPQDERELRYCYEQNLTAVPTMPVVLCHPGRWNTDPGTGITPGKVVHGEHRLTIHRPMPPAGTVTGTARIAGVDDKGEGRGALVHLERTISDTATGEPLATILHTSFCRADGGFGEGFGVRPRRHPIPDRAPDHVVRVPVRPDAALLYRLNADRNPLHADPEYARASGFPRPILHGLCTYGIAGAAVLRHVLGYDAARLRSLECRFTGVVYPGDTVTVSLWDGPGAASFRAEVEERSTVVLDNGSAEVTA